MHKKIQKKLLTLAFAIVILFSVAQIPAPRAHTIAYAATSSIEKTFFSNIQLTEAIPLTFYKNEVYIIKGQVILSDAKEATIIIEKKDGSSRDIFIGSLTGKTFEIPVYFEQTGSFNIGIIAGESGKSRATKISVVSTIPKSKTLKTAPKRLGNLGIDFKNNKTIIKIPDSAQLLKEITITQGTNKVTYISRQNEKILPINYSQFKNFTAKKATISVKTASIQQENPLSITSEFSSPVYKTFEATNHQFSKVSTDEIFINLPEKISTLKKFSLSGRAKTLLESIGFIIKPNGFVDETTISADNPSSDKEFINNNSSLTFNYTPTSKGTYIVEINDSNSIPVVNHPIYIGNAIPLIPDFFDMNERTMFTNNFDLTALRQELLSNINTDRIKYGLGTIQMSEELNNIAQSHSEDMAKNGFFGHVNLAGESPDDRRIKAGIPTSVGENLAKDTAINFAHEGLMRSASHRSNILNEGWTSIGLGIAEQDGYLYITEEFSTEALSPSQLDEKEDELVSAINAKRIAKNLNSLQNTTILKNGANYINSKIITENLTLSTLTSSLIEDAMNLHKISGSVTAIGRNYATWQGILDSVTKDEDTISKTNVQNIGIDAQMDTKGNIQVVIFIQQK
ncbi:MAG: CAP domain-containing protein [Candidatus Gracilibacteria bacterium]|jgi:uncharacterized protein YkwD